MAGLTIPNEWRARPHQQSLYDSFGHGKRFLRGCAVWHRRAGKDSTALNLTARDMFKRVGVYWHLFPEQAQARKAIWNGIDRDGRRIIDQFLPPAVRKRKSDQEMLIEAANGSVWQMAGSDNYDSLVGSNPIGVVFSEWSLANPEAWDYIRPILTENGGWALFIYTPRGRNHGYATWQMALGNDDWFCQRLTVDDTGLVSKADIDAERAAGMSDAKIAQEFYCSFDDTGDDQFIPSEHVLAARKRRVLPEAWEPTLIGVDVARFGDDESVIKVRRGRDAKSIPARVFRGLDTMQLASRVVEDINRYQADAVFVDGTGLGGGVVDRLRQLGYKVFDVQFGAASDHSVTAEKAANKRTELWASMREWLRSEVAIEDDDMLEAQLLGPLYGYDAQNRLLLEKKDDMRKRGLRSPDRADALALTFAYPVARVDADWSDADDARDRGRDDDTGY